jgi:CRP-like cAMP-binding protein
MRRNSTQGGQMPELPDAGAIAQQVKARIKQIEDQLRQHDKLTDELERLRDALSRLEGAARSRVRTVRRTRTPGAKPAGGATRTRAATSATAAKPATGAKSSTVPARAPRGQNKAKVLDALKDGPMTASQIAKATGIAPGTVSTLLTRLAKTGELAKVERGYRLPQ